ncbi:MAG: hypothetical protein WAM14_22965 [Candidatus Nitrosopolaris sp.]
MSSMSFPSYNPLTNGITTGALGVVSFIIEAPAVVLELFVPLAKAGFSEMASGNAIIIPKTPLQQQLLQPTQQQKAQQNITRQ